MNMLQHPQLLMNIVSKKRYLPLSILCKCFAVFIVGCCTLASSAQSQPSSIRDYVSVDTVLNFKMETTSSYSEPVAASWGQLYAFTNFNAKDGTDSIKIHFVDASSFETKTVTIEERGIFKRMRHNKYVSFDGIGFTDVRLVLSWGGRLLVFKKKADGGYVKEKSVKVPVDYRTMQLVNDSVVVLSQYYHGSDNPTGLALFNFDQETVIHLIRPYHNSTYNSYMSNFSIMDYCNGKVVWTHNNEYSFIEYDTTLRRVDSVSRQDLQWHPIPEKCLARLDKIEKYSAVNIIETLMGVYDSVDVIIGCYWLDETHLAIVRKPTNANGSSVPLLDVWSKKTGHWRRSLSDIADDGYRAQKKPILSRNNIPIGFMTNASVKVTAGKIVSLSTQGCVANPIDMPLSEYLSEQERYLTENDFYIQLYIYSHKLSNE